MHSVIDFLKGAASRNAEGIASCYCSRAGQVVAWNDAFMCGAPSPFPLTADVNVPAEELDRALSGKSMKEGVPRVELTTMTNPSTKAEEPAIVLRSSRSRVTIRSRDGEPEPPPDLDAVEWRKVPDGFAAALKLASGFVGDKAWTQGVRAWRDRVTAVSNLCGVDVTVPGLDVLEPVLLSDRVVSFVVARGKPAEFAQLPGLILFRWPGEWWMRARQLAYEMPADTVEKFFSAAGTEAPVAIDSETRETFAEAVHQGGAPTVTLDRRGWHSGQGASVADVLMAGAALLPEDHSSMWSARHLGTVLDCASSWNPSAYPKLAAFLGENVRGYVVGMTA